jgi:hypothetical protein
LFCLFWRWGLENYLPWLAWSHDPPYLSLPNSQGYRWEPLVPSSDTLLIKTPDRVLMLVTYKYITDHSEDSG